MLVPGLQQLAPGDPRVVLAGEERGEPQVLAQIRAEPWLDWSLPVQYLHRMDNVVHGDPGYSWRIRQPVPGLIETRLPVTLQLSVMAFAFAVAIGVPARIAAIVMRHARAATLTVLGQDYVPAARANGLTAARVVPRHALRNAVIAQVTFGAPQLGTPLSGAVLTEQVLSIPGFAKMIADAAFNRHYPVMQGVVPVAAFFYGVFNFLADVLYVVINPRRLRS